MGTDPTSVYQYFDSRQILIYAGITKQGPGRQSQHASSADWWRYVASSTIEHYDTRDEAKTRESWLIRTQRPPFNRQENPGWLDLRLAYWTLFDPGSLPEPEPDIDTDEGWPDAGPQLARWSRCGHCYACVFTDGKEACYLQRSDSDVPTCPECKQENCLYALGHQVGEEDESSTYFRTYWQLSKSFVDAANTPDDPMSDVIRRFLDAGAEIYEHMAPDLKHAIRTVESGISEDGDCEAADLRRTLMVLKCLIGPEEFNSPWDLDLEERADKSEEPPF